jgi:hypothetical protein
MTMTLVLTMTTPAMTTMIFKGDFMQKDKGHGHMLYWFSVGN